MGLDLALRGAPLQLSDFGRPLTPEEQLAAEQTRAEMTSTPGRAWKSAGLGAKAASLWDAANAAYIDNDLERAQQLEAQAKEYGQRAGIMAVPIQETKDINGVGDAVDYATGHLVSGVRSTLPVIGASTAGGFLGGPVGAGLGALGAGYGLGREQSLSQSMQDEAIRNTRSYQDMRNTAHLQGLAEGALDALVPAAMTGKVFRGFTAKGLGPAFPQMMNYTEKRAWLEGQKTAARELAESGLGGAARHFGKNVAEGFGGEFITGGAQDVSGQMFQNELRGDPVGNVDWRQAFESALAEGVGGTGFGAIGGGAEIIGAHRANPDVGLIGGYDLGEKAVGASYDTLKGALSAAYETAKEYAPAIYAETGKTMSFIYKELGEVTKALYPVLKEDTANIIRTVSPDVWGLVKTLGYDVADVAKVLGKDGLAALSTVARDLTPEDLRTEIDAAMKRVGDATMKGAAEGLRQSEVVNALERGVDGEMTSPARALGRNIGATVAGVGEGLAKGLWNEGKKAAGHLRDKLDALTGEVSGIFNKGLKTALDSTDIPGMLREARPFIDTPESELKRRGLSETGARTETVASSNEATTTTMQAIRTVIDAVGLTDEHPTVARFAELEAKAKGSPKSLGSADRKALGRLSDEFSNLLDDRQAVDKLAGGNEQVPHSRAKRNEDKETDLFFRDDVKTVVSELFANTPIGKSAAQIKTAADNVARVVDGIAAGRSTKAKPGEEAVDYLSRAKGFAEYLAGVFGKDAVDNFFYKLEDLAHARYGPESAQGLRLARARGRDFADFVEKMTTPGHNGHPLINLDLWTYADDSPSSRARRGTRIIRELMQAVRDAREAEARPALSDEEVLSGITPANGGAAEYINRRDALAKARKPEHLKKLTKDLVMSGVIRPNTMPQIVKELEAYEKSGLEEPDKHGPVPDADQAASRVVEIEDPNDFDERQLAAEGTSTDDSDADNEKLTMRDDNERGTHGEFQGVSWHGAESFTGEGTQAKRKRGGVPTPVHRFNRGEHLDKGEMSSETRALGAELDARYGHRVTERGFMRVTEWADEQVAASSGKMRRKTLLEKARDAVLAHDEARKERLNERAKFSKSEAHSAQIARELKEIDARKEYAKGATAEQFFDRYKAYGYYRLTQHPGGNVVFTVKDLQRYSVRDGETVEEYIDRQITEDDVFSKPFSREVYKASLLPVKLEGDKGWLALDLPRLLEATRRRHQPGDTSGVTSHSRKARSGGPLTSTEGYSSDYRKGLIQDVSNLLATIQLTKEVAPDAFGKWAKGELNTTNTGKHTAYDELNPEQVVSRDLEARQALTWGDLRGVKVDADGKLRKDSTRFVRTRVATTVKDHWGREQTEFVEKIKKNHWTPGEMSKETLDTVVTPTQAKGVDANNLRLQGARGVEVAALRKVDAPGKLFNLNARALLRHMLERVGHDPSAMMHEGLPRPLAVRLLWEGMHELREQGYELRETSAAVANMVEVYDAGEYLDHFGDLVPNKVTLGSLRGKIHPDNDNNTPHDIETARVQQIKENLAKLRRDLVSKSGDGENALVREQQREKLIRLQKQREKLVTALDTLETELKKKAAEAEARFEGSLGPALREYPESERAKAARAEANNIKDSETNDRAREELENTIALREKRLSKLDKEIAALKSTVSLSEDAQKGLTETLSKQEWNERNLGWTTGEPTDDDHRALRYSPEEMENIRVNEVVGDLKKLSDGDPSLFDISTELEKIYTPKRRQGKASATPMTDAQKLDALRSLSMRVALLFPEVKWDTGGYEKGVKPADTSRPHERLIKDTEAWVAQQEADGKPVDPKIKETLAYVKDRQVKDKQDAEVIAKHPSHNPSTSGKRGTGLGGLEVDPRTINPLDAETQGKQRAAKQKRADEAAKARQWLKDNPEFDEGQLDTPQPDAPQTETTQVETPPQPMSVEKIVAQVMAGKFKHDVQREVLPTLSEADTWKLYEKLKNAQRRPGTDRAATVRELSMRGYDALSYNDWLDKQAVPFSKAKRQDLGMARKLFEPQMHEGFAKSLDEIKTIYERELRPTIAERVAEQNPEDQRKQGMAEQAKKGRNDRLREAIGRLVPICRTPVVLRQIMEKEGGKLFKHSELVVGLGSTVLLKGINKHGVSQHSAPVPFEILRNLPALLADPLAVFKSLPGSSDPSSYKVLLDVEVNGGPVLVALQPNMSVKQAGGAQAHWQASVYPVSWDKDVAHWVKAGALRYVNEEGRLARIVPQQSRESRDENVSTQGDLENSITSEGFDSQAAITAAKEAGNPVITKAEVAALPETAWSKAKNPNATADAKPSEDYQPGEEFKRIIGETFGFELVGKEDWAAKWTLDDKGQLKDVLMSFYGLNEAESIGMERHEAWHGVEQLLEGMGDVGKQILDDITSWADSEHARAWLAKKLEPYPDALADIDDAKNPKLAAKERKAYAFQFFMEEGKMPPGKAQGWFNKIKEAIRKFFNWTGLKTTSDLQRAEAFFKYVGEGNFLRDAENPASVLEGLGKTKTDKFVEDVKGAIKPISDAVDVLFAHTADRVKSMKIGAYTELLKIYEGESGKGGYMLAQRTQFNRHANMFIHMRKGKDEKALPGVVREFKEKFRGYLSQALSAEDIQNLYDKVNTFNHDAINDNMEAFLNDLRLYGGLKDKTPGELRNIASDIANKGYYYDENAPIRLFEKKPEIMEKWKERSPNGEIYRLVRIGTRMVERNRFFGKNDERLHNLLAQGNHEASAEQQELMRKVVDAFEGRLGGDLSPGMRTLFNALTTANNIRLLPMAVFSQMLDPVRLAARKNDFASSLDPLFKGIKDMPRAWFDNAEKQGAKDTWEKLAEETGILANLALGNMMSELNLGYRMGGKLGWLNDNFFKYNFMEQWERSMTVSATKMGVEFLREHSASKTAQSKRYLDELGLDSGDVKFDKDGALITDEKVSAALAQYVAESLAHPDAGSNPLWMNDQRFALMSHLKRFSFAHQRYVLDRGVREYKLGNASILAPAVMAVPWMLTVDALRDAINPFSSTGYKADWGAADYLTSGMDRAGHTGKWQMPHDVMRNLTHGGDPFSPVLGPTADAFGRIVRKTRKGDGVEAMIDAMPGSSLFRPM